MDADRECAEGWDAAMITTARLAEMRGSPDVLDGGARMAFDMTATSAWDMVGVTPKMPEPKEK